MSYDDKVAHSDGWPESPKTGNDYWLDHLSLTAARDVEQEFTLDLDGGATQRIARVQLIIRGVLKRVKAGRYERQPHKVMTHEEYVVTPLNGWHEVCRDVDGAGGVGIRYLTE